TTIARERPGEVLSAPAWLPDGGLVFQREDLLDSAVGARLDRADADGTNRRLLVDQATAPAISPDGRLLVFVRKGQPDRLIAVPLEGGAEQILVDDPSFLALAFPRFSPDGRSIAFSAVGGPSTRRAPGPSADPGWPVVGAPVAA